MRVKKTHIIDSMRRAAKKDFNLRVQSANRKKNDLERIADADIVEFMIDSFNSQIQNQKIRDLENMLKSIMQK